MKKRLTEMAIDVLIVLAVVFLWFHFKENKAPVGALVPAKVADQVKDTPKETVACKNIVVYKTAAKGELNLPDTTKADANTHVLAASRVEPDLHAVTVITTINTETGQSETLQRREPYPWMRAEQSGELRLDYGQSNAGTVARLSITENLLQVRAVHFGVSAAIDTGGNMFAGGGIGYRW